MKRALVAAILVASCTAELTTQPIIPPGLASDPQSPASAPRGSALRPEICRADPTSEVAGDSTLQFFGECNLAFTEKAECREAVDDYYVIAKRTLAGGQIFNFFANLERYAGHPGDYQNVQIHVTLRDKKLMYRWLTFEGSASVVDGEKPSVEFPNTWLAPVTGTPAVGWIILEGTLGCVSDQDNDRASAEIHYDKALLERSRSRADVALTELLAATSADPTMAEARNALGLVYHDLQRSAEAIAQYEKAVQLQPNFSDAHANLGTLLTELGRYDEAIEHFQVAMEDDSYETPYVAEGGMGWAYYLKGDAEKASKHLQSAMRASPTFCRGYLWLARMGVEREQPAQALVYASRFEKFCTKNPAVEASVPPADRHTMQYYAGAALAKSGDRVGAEASLRACASGDPTSELGRKCQRALDALK